MADTLRSLGAQVRAVRGARGLTQPQLAERVGRPQSRISEFETDLLKGRSGGDRLTLLAQICEALRLTPILVPADKLAAVIAVLGTEARPLANTAPDPFDELFIDLTEPPRG